MTPPTPSFEQFYDTHLEEIYGYLAFRLSGDADTAQDLCQEVFEAALSGFDDVRDAGRIRGWLFQIARNKLADHFRGLASRNGSMSFDAICESLGGESTRFEASKKRERAVLASHVMRGLPNRYAELLEDKYIRGLSIREMATLHTLSEKAVESAMSRARDAFRRDYEALFAKEEASR